MSASGPKRTSLVAPHMSAFGSKADVPFCGADVSFRPKADDIHSHFYFVHLTMYDALEHLEDQ
jgi:hypothetical protein